MWLNFFQEEGQNNQLYACVHNRKIESKGAYMCVLPAPIKDSKGFLYCELCLVSLDYIVQIHCQYIQVCEGLTHHSTLQIDLELRSNTHHGILHVLVNIFLGC